MADHGRLSRSRTVFWLVPLLAMLVSAPARADTLLEDHFGVTLQLDTDPAHAQNDSFRGARSYHFLYSSFTPSGPASINYVVDDWHGSWDPNSITDRNDLVYHGYPGGGPGQRPAGAEPYDVEAIYFNNDYDYFYIAIVTSVDTTPGIVEGRLGGDPILVIAGDLGIDLGLNGARNGTDTFSYDFAVNLNHETRPASGNVTVADSVVGDELYRTANTDWYTGTVANAVAALGEHTNFDPDYDGGRGTFLGDGSDGIETSYYVYNFPGGLRESFYDTYVIEVKLPRSLLGAADPDAGMPVGLSFTPGCRNDGHTTYGIVRLYGTVNPEPSSFLLAGLGAVILGLAVRRARRRQRRSPLASS